MHRPGHAASSARAIERLSPKSVLAVSESFCTCANQPAPWSARMRTGVQVSGPPAVPSSARANQALPSVQ
jgi:hypothetical protein